MPLRGMAVVCDSRPHTALCLCGVIEIMPLRGMAVVTADIILCYLTTSLNVREASAVVMSTK